ncbi:hypothetical protein CRG98_010486 [Punica granatum]|uniref:Uncharacterized protein n=1 Tax=Punica granatum TaxID=22663 RepID=A0A2I0KKU5_PUNGR|nr:hypothetical protein CRG98_010486 [Punica granatum]
MTTESLVPAAAGNPPAGEETNRNSKRVIVKDSIPFKSRCRSVRTWEFCDQDDDGPESEDCPVIRFSKELLRKVRAPWWGSLIIEVLGRKIDVCPEQEISRSAGKHSDQPAPAEVQRDSVQQQQDDPGPSGPNKCRKPNSMEASKKKAETVPRENGGEVHKGKGLVKPMFQNSGPAPSGCENF